MLQLKDVDLAERSQINEIYQREAIAELPSDNWDCGSSRLAMIARRVFCKPACTMKTSAGLSEQCGISQARKMGSVLWGCSGSLESEAIRRHGRCCTSCVEPWFVPVVSVCGVPSKLMRPIGEHRKKAQLAG